VTLRVEREGVIQRIRAKSVRRPRARPQFTVIRDRNFSNPRRRERRRPARAWPRSARDPNRAFVGRLFLASPGLRAWPSLLRLNPTDYSVDNLVNRKIAGIDHVHAPSRFATLPSGPAFSSHRIDLYAAYYILPPLRFDGVHALPHCPREHILCHSVRSAVAQRSKRITSWQSRRATLISSMSSADGHARISPMMAPPTTPVSLPRCFIFERHLNPTLGHML
jgi:hypothetical protein